MKHLSLACLSTILILTGCSTTSSTFSCNKTAGDSCLTIEEVDAMTQYADDPVIVKHASHTGYQKQGVWIGKRSDDARHAE